jgi:DNA-directed RNA polymerase subunit F
MSDDTNQALAEALIADLKARRGADYGAFDQAEALQLRAVARIVDTAPSLAALRELRIVLAKYRAATEHETLPPA